MNAEGRPPNSPIELDLPPARTTAPPQGPPRPEPWRPPPPPPPASWLQENLRTVAVLAVVGVIVLAGYLWFNRPVLIPDLALKDAAGQSTTLSGLREGKPRLLIVFLAKGDTFSTVALRTLKDAHGAKSSSMAFVGLVMGTQAEAEAFRAETEAPFPMYGLKDLLNQNPFEVRDLLKKVGTETIVAASISGGTVVVVDRENKVVLRLEKDDLKDLGAKLAKLR